MKEQEPPNLRLLQNQWLQRINEMAQMHFDGKLTQSIVQEWIKSLPEDDKEEAQSDLEITLSERIEKLPK